MTTFFSNLLVKKSVNKLLLRNNALDNAINDQAEPKGTVSNRRWWPLLNIANELLKSQ
jgi:hypothetical protein